MQHKHNQISDTMDYDEMKRYVPRELRAQFEEIIAGKRLPELYYDRPFKRIFDADLHPERVQTLFRLIFGQDDAVKNSLKNEMTHVSIYSKQTILDLLSQLGSGGILDLEMQVAAQDFLFTRVQIYASDMILLQYSVNRGERKDDLHFDNVEQSYFAVLVKEDIPAFQDSQCFFHRECRTTDTGFILPSLVNTVYIELDKCLKQWENHTCPEEYAELAPWLCAIADINHPQLKSASVQTGAMESIWNELALMAKDRKELAKIMFEKYEEVIRKSEIASARKKGLEEGLAAGRAEGHAEGYLEALEHLNLLNQKLIESGREADLLRAAQDPVYQKELLKQLNI